MKEWTSDLIIIIFVDYTIYHLFYIHARLRKHTDFYQIYSISLYIVKRRESILYFSLELTRKQKWWQTKIVDTGDNAEFYSIFFVLRDAIIVTLQSSSRYNPVIAYHIYLENYFFSSLNKSSFSEDVYSQYSTFVSFNSPLNDHWFMSCSSNSLDVGLTAPRFDQRFNPKSDHWCVISGNKSIKPTLFNVHLTLFLIDGNDAPDTVKPTHKTTNIPWQRESIITTGHRYPRNRIPGVCRDSSVLTEDRAADWSSTGPCVSGPCVGTLSCHQPWYINPRAFIFTGIFWYVGLFSSRWDRGHIS